MFFKNINSMFARILEYALYVFFASFPFINYGFYLYTGTTTRAINLTIFITVASIALAFYIFYSKDRLVLLKSPITGVLGLYFLIVAIAAYFGFNFNTSFWSNVTRMTGLWFFINLGMLYLFITSVLRDQKKIVSLIRVIVFSTAVYSVLALLSPEGLGLLFKGYESDGFTLGNSTFASMYVFGAFILSLYYLFSGNVRKWWQYLLPVLILINPFTFNYQIFEGNFGNGFFGEAKASSIVMWLSLVSIFVAWLISKIKNEKTFRNTTIGVFVFVFIGIGYAGFSLISPNGYLRELYLSEATGARPLIWEVSSRVIADRPALGWGIDNFERVFERYYDNRLLQDEYGNEAWFDRAHNIFIDQTIDNGYVGLLVYILIYIVTGLALLFVVLKSKIRNDQMLATFLLIYFGLHIFELQTAFDTVISYVLLAFMFALASNLFYKSYLEEKKKDLSYELPGYLGYMSSTLLAGFFIWSLFAGLIPFIKTQNANGYMRIVGSSEKRLLRYDALFGSRIDIAAFLWRTSADLQRGIAENPKVLSEPKKVASLNREFEYLATRYREYLVKNPNDYRSHLNLADILMYQRLFEVDKLAEAQAVLSDAVNLVPQDPQAYWMKAVAYIYMKDFPNARLWAKKGFDLNPQIKESAKIMKYVEESIKTFPDIDLYFFAQT